jgi:hypothetical protein
MDEIDGIDYEILDDGTCSYCGYQTELAEMPDGELDWYPFCPNCEDYNQEQMMEAMFKLVVN